ncbi:hypothetical protein [Streptomyces sp. NPDC001652]|uniref:hypothetical protein n=1 Tax=Streptomyces sp. NPDC001652 TaxID=3154393 RepID=UPI0033276F44
MRVRPGDPGYHRDHLEQVLHALPTRSARELRALLHDLDAVILRRARVLPYSSPGVSWWKWFTHPAAKDADVDAKVMRAYLEQREIVTTGVHPARRLRR